MTLINDSFLRINFNKIVIYKYKLGRLIGGFYSDSGFHYVIITEKGHFTSTPYKQHIYILKENEEKEMDSNLKPQHCPPFKEPVVEDFRGQLIYSADKKLAIKAQSSLLFNKIITSHGGIYRVVGFSIQPDGYYLLTYNLEGRKSYLEIISPYEDNTFNKETLFMLDKLIPFEEEIIEEYL